MRKARGTLPNPDELGAPEKYTEWRPAQDEVLEWIIDQEERFVAAGVSTGAGKSLLSVLSGSMLSEEKVFLRRIGLDKEDSKKVIPRAVILTHRIGLAHQYQREFAEMGMAEIHGVRNYNPHGRVNDPAFEGLDYNKQLGIASQAPLVVTTYAYYLASKFARGLGSFDVMICDEGDQAFDALSGFFDITLEESDLYKWKQPWPGKLHGPKEWATWIVKSGVLKNLDKRKTEIMGEIALSDGGDKLLIDQYDQISRLITGLTLIREQKGEWICYEDGYKARLAKIWPGEESMTRLFVDVPKVVLMSGTIRPKTMELLGVESYAFKEYPHPFHQNVRPVYWCPTIVAVESRADAMDWNEWCTKIDQIAHHFKEEKGIVHTVSYNRAKMFEDKSQMKNTGNLVTHGRRDVQDTISWFRSSDAPLVLISPVLTTGYDVPEAGWQVIGKVPWPSTRDPLIQARRHRDKDYIHYIIAREIVQMAGRIVRGPDWDDRGVTVLIDDTWAWFWRVAQPHMPKWFRIYKAATIQDLV